MSKLLSLNFGKFALFALVSLSGCASHRMVPSIDQLSKFEPDCRIAQQQIDWLKSLKPTLKEKQDSRLQMALFGGFSSDYRKNRDIVDNKVDWMINLNIRDVYRVCYNQG